MLGDLALACRLARDFRRWPNKAQFPPNRVRRSKPHSTLSAVLMRNRAAKALIASADLALQKAQ